MKGWDILHWIYYSYILIKHNYGYIIYFLWLVTDHFAYKPLCHQITESHYSTFFQKFLWMELSNRKTFEIFLNFLPAQIWRFFRGRYQFFFPNLARVTTQDGIHAGVGYWWVSPNFYQVISVAGSLLGYCSNYSYHVFV